MAAQPEFALNQIVAPRMGSRAFIDLAASLGCVGVELRNDLADKRLTDAAFLDGLAPAAVGDHARARGVRLLGFSEAYGFNLWSPEMAGAVQRLIDQARAAGAESVSLIPRNDAPRYAAGERDEALRRSLGEILPMLERAGLIGLIEPLGFVTSSLRRKADAVAAIEAVGGAAHYRLVHDTFHHHLAGETDVFPEQTGIVHISGVVEPALAIEDMRDEHRILVDAHDRLGNLDQMRALLDAGYAGAFSYEPFSPEVHALHPVAKALADSIAFVRDQVARSASDAR